MAPAAAVIIVAAPRLQRLLRCRETHCMPMGVDGGIVDITAQVQAVGNGLADDHVKGARLHDPPRFRCMQSGGGIGPGLFRPGARMRPGELGGCVSVGAHRPEWLSPRARMPGMRLRALL
jgi:hypothetical protein